MAIENNYNCTAFQTSPSKFGKLKLIRTYF